MPFGASTLEFFEQNKKRAMLRVPKFSSATMGDGWVRRFPLPLQSLALGQLSERRTAAEEPQHRHKGA